VDNAHEQLRQAESSQRQVQMAASDVETARVGVRQAEESVRLARAGRRRYNVSLADIKAARAGVGQAAAAHDLVSATERKYTVYSPIAGTVAGRSVDLGEGAAPGLPVMRIVNSDPIRVDCQVGELDIDRVKVGDQGATTVDGLPGQEFVGRVMAITPQALKDQRNYIARVEVGNPQALIKPGMFARVKLVLSEKPDAVIVPRDCLVERGADRSAYVVDNGAIKVVKVKVGISNRSQMEILAGVQPGAMLVSAGQAMLAEGQKVKPVTAKPGA
jgi:membrane fusion protein (multidrug efflux system)